MTPMRPARERCEEGEGLEAEEEAAGDPELDVDEDTVGEDVEAEDVGDTTADVDGAEGVAEEGGVVSVVVVAVLGVALGAGLVSPP
jgi:hypothetical protein